MNIGKAKLYQQCHTQVVAINLFKSIKKIQLRTRKILANK